MILRKIENRERERSMRKGKQHERERATVMEGKEKRKKWRLEEQLKRER